MLLMSAKTFIDNNVDSQYHGTGHSVGIHTGIDLIWNVKTLPVSLQWGCWNVYVYRFKARVGPGGWGSANLNVIHPKSVYERQNGDKWLQDRMYYLMINLYYGTGNASNEPTSQYPSIWGFN